MEIKSGKFSKEMQAKIMAAFNNDNKIDESEARQLGLSKEQAEALTKELSGERESSTDKIELTQKDKDFCYTIVLNKNAEGKSEGTLTWNGDSLAKIRTVYPNAKTPYLKDGVVTILDKDGNPVADKNGNPLKIEYVQKQKIFSEELAEINVLGHKANPMEKLLHQAEIQNELNRLNSLPDAEESYTEIMRSIAFDKMNKKEQTEAILKWTGEKFFAAKENNDIKAMKEYLIQGFGLAMQKMDMASIGSTNISVEGFKGFLKTWSGLDAFCEYINNKVDDGSENLTKSEKIWEFTKGVGDAVDHFIGTQGVAFMGTLALATEAAAAGGIGELWAVATQSYFGFEGIGSIAEGSYLLAEANTSEEFRQAGDMVGTGVIMTHGAVKSFKSALTGKLQAGLSVNKALKEIKKAKTIDELKEIQDNMPDFPYSEKEKQVLMMECLKQSNKIITEGRENNTARTLEGRAKDTELTEVAPFAERLNEKITPEDLIPERKQTELENGEFTSEGEFKSDGTKTVSETPLGKSKTYKQMPNGKEQLIATTPKELETQILNVVGGKKLSENVKNNIENLLKNPDITIKDISEVIETLRYIQLTAEYANDFIIRGIKKVQNFQNFKANLDTYAKFAKKMYDGYLQYASDYTWNPHSRKIQNFLSDRMNLEQLLKLDEIEPEALNRNIAKFKELGFMLKEAVCYDRTSFNEYMLKSHSDKYFERLDYIDEFNKKQYKELPPSDDKYYTNIVTKGGLEDDANFAVIKKNLEAYRSSLSYTGGSSSLLYNSSTKEAEWITDFEAKIPEEKRMLAYDNYHWMVREGQAKEVVDKYAEFINALPTEMLDGLISVRSSYPAKYDVVFDKFHHFKYGQKESQTETLNELITRAKILAKVPNLANYRGHRDMDSFLVSDFLTKTEFKNSAKVLEFVENAEPYALSKYRMNTEYNSRDKSFSEIMNEADLDLWTENAKLHHELNPAYREHLNSRESLPVKGGFNENFDFNYDIPTEEFKARINAINEYTDKLDMKTLDYIYVGRIKPEKRILDTLTQLKPEVIQNIDAYSSGTYINELGEYSDNGLKNFITFANKYSNETDLIRNIKNQKFRKILDGLSENEISILNKYVLTHEQPSYFDPDTEMIKKRIASIPDKVKKYYHDNDNFLLDKYTGDRLFNEDCSLKENSPFEYLNTLSDTELKAIGTKAISEFVDRNGHSWNGVKEFDPARLKALTELPEPLLTKLEGGNKYALLTSDEYIIDVQKITSRYNELVKYNRFEKISGDMAKDFCTMPDYSYNMIIECLKKHNDKLSEDSFYDIYQLMPKNTDFSPKEINYIREKLINNPANNPNDIGYELRFLYSRYSTLTKPENMPFQKEVLENLIEKGHKDNVTIGTILICIGRGEIETAKIVYDCALTAWEDPAVNPANVGELVSNISDKCEEFAQKAFHHPKFMGKKDHLPDILRNLNEYNKNLAYFLYLESDKFKVEDGNRILRNVTKENNYFIEQLCKEGGLTNNAIATVAAYTQKEKGNLGKAEKLLTSEDMKKWAEENINNGVDLETITHLGRTQKKIYTDKRIAQETLDSQAKKEAARTMQQQNVKEEVLADVDAVETITKALMELNVPEGMAKNAYAKLCVDSNGNVDKVKLDAAKSLIKAYGFYTRVNKKGQTAINPNLTPKDITEIFKLATGDKMSAQNGMFRPHVIKDIIALKECGIDDIKFAMNLAAVKNMGLIEMKARFKGETRQDLARRIDEGVNNEVTQALKSRGIDLEAIKEKALTSDKKIADMTVKEGQGSAEVRSLDAVVGTERLVLGKFKDKLDPEIWQSKEAFHNWAEQKLEDMTDWEKHPEYKSVDFPNYNTPRQNRLREWVDFLKSDESGVKDDVFAQILFLDGIIKEMKPDNAYTPPAISREIFEHVYNELLAGNTNVSITKEYAELNRKKAIEKYGTPTVSEDGTEGTWVKIPQSKRGEPLYDEHVAMVQSLAEGSAWCLRFENAHGYLQQGDIHFFVDANGNSQIAIDVLPDGKIYEMQRRYKQDGTVPVPYVVPIAKYIEENGFTGRENQIKEALNAKPEFDRRKSEYTKMLEEGNAQGIFKELGINVSVKEDGTYLIDSYTAFVPNTKYTLFDLGINEDRLFENVSEIRFGMGLEGSALKSAPKLKKVGYTISFGDNKANDLSGLEEINGKKISWDKH